MSLSGRRFALSAGRFPTSSASAEVPVDFYELLGRDAGSLVRSAWSRLGGTAASRDDALRAQLPEALASVSLELETSDVRGFGGRRRLLRKLSIREAQ
jgi:hypothetical protein